MDPMEQLVVAADCALRTDGKLKNWHEPAATARAQLDSGSQGNERGDNLSGGRGLGDVATDGGALADLGRANDSSGLGKGLERGGKPRGQLVHRGARTDRHCAVGSHDGGSANLLPLDVNDAGGALRSGFQRDEKVGPARQHLCLITMLLEGVETALYGRRLEISEWAHG